MKPLVYAFPGNERIGAELAKALEGERGEIEVRHFPDDESYVRLLTSPAQRDVLLVCALSRPDAWSLPLYFAAATARELGALRVGLVAPYLGYMRQDARFHAGEAISSIHYARWLSQFLDWLVTVDPHLHRHASLRDIYSIDTAVAPAAPAISRWIAAHVDKPLLIGPDAESAQWIASVASGAKCPFVVARKQRRGDFDVQVGLPDLTAWRDRTPVLIDDIVSTARTMLGAVEQLRSAGLAQPPVCIGVHALFAADAYAALVAAVGVGAVVSCNTIPHASNAIDIGAELTTAVRDAMRVHPKTLDADRSARA